MSQIDLDNLLDETLDDIEDLPEYKSFPKGSYKLSVTMSAKEVNDKPAVEMEMKCLEVLELADADAAAPAEGDTSSILFFLDNPFGKGKLKKAATPLAESLGASSVREIVEACQGIECVAVLKQTVNKKDADSPYQELVEIAVV